MAFGTMSAAGATSAETIRNTEPELVALLLKAGADSNSADRAGRTPLMFAAAQGRLELVQVLLAGGADVEAKAANGKTAWQVATGEEIARVLQEARGKR
jgi:ankyrin repeat protein